MNLDIEYEAELEIIFWDHYKHLFCGISKFDLYNGNMKLGEGYFVNPV